MAYKLKREVKYAEIKQIPKLLNDLFTDIKKLKFSLRKSKEFTTFWIIPCGLEVIVENSKNYPGKEIPFGSDKILDQSP